VSFQFLLVRDSLAPPQPRTDPGGGPRPEIKAGFGSETVDDPVGDGGVEHVPAAGRVHGPDGVGGRSNPAAADQGDVAFCAQRDADKGAPQPGQTATGFHGVSRQGLRKRLRGDEAAAQAGDLQHAVPERPRVADDGNSRLPGLRAGKKGCLGEEPVRVERPAGAQPLQIEFLRGQRRPRRPLPKNRPACGAGLGRDEGKLRKVALPHPEPARVDPGVAHRSRDRGTEGVVPRDAREIGRQSPAAQGGQGRGNRAAALDFEVREFAFDVGGRIGRDDSNVVEGALPETEDGGFGGRGALA